MAELEGNVLLQSVEVAVDCCVVPPSRDYELQPSVDVVSRPQKVIELVVKTGEILLVVLGVDEKL
jgi:hypothetical protein